MLHDDALETFTAPADLDAAIRRNGVTICAAFGLGWFIGGASILADTAAYWIGIGLAGVLSLGLIAATGRIVSSRHRPRELPRDWQSRYRFWVVIEIVLVAAAILVLRTLGLASFLPGTIAAIVGTHLVPLAAAFDEPKYRVAGYGLLVAGAAGIVAGLGGGLLGVAVAGFASSAILWVTAGWVLLAG